jgi:hypothetical protein
MNGMVSWMETLWLSSARDLCLSEAMDIPLEANLIFWGKGNFYGIANNAAFQS